MLICQVLLAHYRACIYQELIDRGRHRYSFAAGSGNVEPTIKTWTPPPGTPFHLARTWSPKGLGGAVLQPGLLRLALRDDVDVLVLLGVMWNPFTWLAAIVGRLTGKRVLYWSHGFTRPEPGAVGRLRTLFYRLPHALMLYGHYGKIIALQQGLDHRRVHVIYNSLDYDRQKAERATVTRDELHALRQRVLGTADLPVAICTTRLMPVRRLDLLIEAAAILKAQGREIALLLVGDGPEKDRLRTLAAQRGVRCTLYGACYDEAVLSRLIMMSNVMVAPGKVGLTSLHALAYGTPVVTHSNEANQMPEWEAIVPSLTGSLFTDGDVHDLARAIGHWCAQPWPSESVREACHRLVERAWNPRTQRIIIERALDGEPADDLFWVRQEQPRADAHGQYGARPGFSPSA